MVTRRRKLLLADDSITIQKVVSLTFSDEGMDVVAVSDGQQAVTQLEQDANLPDIVLVDVCMPGPNGYELCERMKGDRRFWHIPVVLLVGTFEPYNEAEARRVGADDVVTKPFQSIRHLISKIGALLDGGRREEEPSTRNLPAPASDQSSFKVARSWNEPTVTEGVEEAPGAARSMAVVEEAPGATQPMTWPATEISFTDLTEDDQMIETRQPMEHAAELRAIESPSPHAAVIEESPRAGQVASPVVADDSLLDLGDLDDLPVIVDTEDFFLDLGDEIPSASLPLPAAPISAAPLPAATMAASAGADTSISYQAVRSEQEMKREEHLEHAQSNGTPSSIEASEVPLLGAPLGAGSSSASDEHQMKLEQLSPDVMDAIVRRVVEHMSRPVIEEIAWEVVPQLSELLIKQQLEEMSAKKS